MMNDGLQIIEAGESHIPDILRLYVSAGIVGASNYTEDEARAQFKTFTRYPYFRVFLAKLGEQPVGTYELILIDNLAKAGAKTAIVEDVAVDPAFQKRGIGRAMMLHARAQAKYHGAYKLALSSNDKRTDAHAFYEALGFSRHGVSFVIEP